MRHGQSPMAGKFKNAMQANSEMLQINNVSENFGVPREVNRSLNFAMITQKKIGASDNHRGS
ncbi:MAG: hypothetical protein KCHDKBKB_02852 [Elusimicrobia bacterium]|nr:hypothetical protein [Elusimicrobiota bacterium]